MDDDPYSPAASQIAEHWQWRPDWLQDRACLWWYLTFEDAPAVRDLARRVQALLRPAPQLDLVPLPWLHLTLLEVGFADEVPAETVDRVVRAAHEGLADFPRVDLDLATVRAMPGALVLEAHSRGLRSLHERLTDAVLRVRGAEGVRGLCAFVPHVSVAYVNRDCAAHEVLGPLDGVDVSTPSPSATVRRVRLAAVTRQRRHYQWTTRAVVPLGASRGPALVSATRREGGG
jgi:2'-5' RNA ligase